MTFDSVYAPLRGLHILAVIAWMAGLLYLPRLFAYHTETAPPGSEFDGHFQVWERKLYRLIMNPAMLVAFVLGLALIWVDAHRHGDGWRFLLEPWMLTKLAGVVFLMWWHLYLGRARTALAAGRRDKTSKFWRAATELPFLAAIVMVLAVTTEFGHP